MGANPIEHTGIYFWVDMHWIVPLVGWKKLSNASIFYGCHTVQHTIQHSLALCHKWQATVSMCQLSASVSQPRRRKGGRVGGVEKGVEEYAEIKTGWRADRSQEAVSVMCQLLLLGELGRMAHFLYHYIWCILPFTFYYPTVNISILVNMTVAAAAALKSKISAIWTLIQLASVPQDGWHGSGAGPLPNVH